MKKFVLLFLLLSFMVVGESKDKLHVYLHASSDLTTGTDSACEEYWRVLSSYRNYKYIHIVNKGWIPSPRLIVN